MTEEQIYQLKKIWRGNEIPIASHLMSFQQALRDEFLQGEPDLKSACLRFATDNLDLRHF